MGALLGYFGGKLDILGQRVIEIWSSLPFLYTIIIISSIIVPVYVPGTISGAPAIVLAPRLDSRGFEWVAITYYIRGEFYREKARDYVGAAIATGVSEPKIMFRHILPNALTPRRLVRAVRHRGEYQLARRTRLSSDSAFPRRRQAGVS